MQTRIAVAAGMLLSALCATGEATAADAPTWIWSTAYHIPPETTSEESGYFSIIEGLDGKIYVGAAKYQVNAYLVAFDPQTKQMQVAVDTHKEIGTTATGFAAQSKIHTRNNVGPSGKIYFGTKQGYARNNEPRLAYPGGYPMVFDPQTGKTRVYEIPVPHQGIISIAPDESRHVAYLSTCSDEKPMSAHFMILDLETGKYRDLVDSQHMYAFIVVDALGRAYHPLLGGDIARYDARSGKLERLKHTIDGQSVTAQSPGAIGLLAHAEGHPINWDVSPDHQTLYSVAMSGNALFRYDLTSEGDTLAGTSPGKLCPEAEATDCRAMCVGPDGTVWAGIAATYTGKGQRLELVSYRPGEAAPLNHGPVAIRNPDFAQFKDADGKDLPYRHGVVRTDGDVLLPRYSVMGICAVEERNDLSDHALPVHAARDSLPAEQVNAQFADLQLAGGARGFVLAKILATAILATTWLFASAHAEEPLPAAGEKIPLIAAITTAYYHNSHADILVSRLLEGDMLDGQGRFPKLKLASLYIDQIEQQQAAFRDAGRALAEKHQVPLYKTVTDALTLGTGRLAVDGVLLIAEHGVYPLAPDGQIQYPKRRLWSEVVKVFDENGRGVPVFNDKHLADTWADAIWIYDASRRLKFPLMAGSSLPVTWRFPAIEIQPDRPIAEVVVLNYGPIETYGFHALEAMQCLIEKRRGGETGVRAVRYLEGQAAWDAIKPGAIDREILDHVLGKLRSRPWPDGKTPEEIVKDPPVLFQLEFRDGLKASLLTLDWHVADWAVAWRYADTRQIESTVFWTQEARPLMHFAYLLGGIEQMMHTGEPPWPVERTLLTTGVLDALFSARSSGAWQAMPHLDIAYQTAWKFQQPLDPPPGRPLDGQ